LTLARGWDPPPPFYQRLKNTPGVVLAEFPFDQDAARNLPFMYFSLWHWRPMVNGYSGIVPASYEARYRELRGFPDARAIAALRTIGVTHVFVHYEAMRKWVGPDAAEAVRQSPDLQIVDVADDVGLYRVRSADGS